MLSPQPNAHTWATDKASYWLHMVTHALELNLLPMRHSEEVVGFEPTILISKTSALDQLGDTSLLLTANDVRFP